MSYEAWIRKALIREYAEEDLRSGRYDSAAFFAQQAAEDMLIKLTGSRPLTHAVSELLEYLALGGLYLRTWRGVPRPWRRITYRPGAQTRASAKQVVGGGGGDEVRDAVWRCVREVAGGLA